MSILKDIRFEELIPDLWSDLESLFGPNGACGGCWCMWWRAERNKPWNQIKGAPAKKMLKSLVQEGKAHGTLAFAGDEPVGWCSFGPRQDFSGLESVKAYKRDDTSNVWSITCFFIHKGWRGKGLVRELLKKAVEAMRKHGVKTVEAYPVSITKNGRKLTGSLAWTGPLKIFEELSFKTIQVTNPLKPLMRLELRK